MLDDIQRRPLDRANCKARCIELDATRYGTIVEIGAGKRGRDLAVSDASCVLEHIAQGDEHWQGMSRSRR